MNLIRISISAAFFASTFTAFAQNTPPVVTSQIADFTEYAAAPARSLDLTTAFADSDVSAAVRMTTVLGTMDFELFGQTKPITVANFLKFPPNIYLGEGIGVATNSKGHVFVYTRSGETRLFEFDQNGAFVREIGQGLYGFAFAHAVRVDPQDNVWAVDEGTNMVIKFNPQGRVVLVLGRRQEITARGHERHGEVLITHALGSVAHAFHEGPGRRVHPAEVSRIEDDSGGIAVAPMHLAVECCNDGVKIGLGMGHAEGAL